MVRAFLYPLSNWKTANKKGPRLFLDPLSTPSGARTLDTLIKSQVLYQLS